MNGKDYKNDDAKTALVDLRTRKKIFHVVLIVHIIIISLILVWGLAVEFFKPERPKSITVSLYTPPETSSAPPAYIPPEKQISKKRIKEKPKKKKKKWKAAKKIKVSKDLVYIKPKKIRPRIKTMDKKKLLTSLKQKRVKISSNIKNTGLSQSYENSVGSYLYQLWDTPDKSILGNKRPEVKVQLNIAANGQLLGAKILKPSGVAAMDKSVEELLQKIKYLPAPNGGARKITLILEVIE
jgi:TonB family protein